MPHQVNRLHHVGIVVSDLSASAAWYRDHLGFEHQYDFELPGARATMIVRGDARLELFTVDGAAAPEAARQDLATVMRFGGINHLALAVDDLETIVAQLAVRGVEIVIPTTDVPNDSGDRFAFIRDNERMLVELFQAAA